MRFKYFIESKDTEGISDDIVKLIKKDCKPYLKDFDRIWNQTFFFSGRMTNTYFKKVTLRQDRKPRDTPLEIHDFIDNWFYKKFGIKARSNVIFCYLDVYKVSNYGKPHVIFPIGKYTAISSNRVNDLYDEVESSLVDLNTKRDRSKYYNGTELKVLWNNLNYDYQDEAKNDIIQILNRSDYKINQKTSGEIMLHCKEYYILDVHPMYDDDFKHKLTGRMIVK